METNKYFISQISMKVCLCIILCNIITQDKEVSHPTLVMPRTVSVIDDPFTWSHVLKIFLILRLTFQYAVSYHLNDRCSTSNERKPI